MGVITISRQIGSGGTYIAESVAATLGLVLIDKEDIEAIMGEYGFSAFSAVYDSAPGFWGRYDEHRSLTITFLRSALQAFAKVGDIVLLGRGGFGLLQGYTDALNVRLKAPLEARVLRKQAEYGQSDRQCKQILIRNEEIRTMFVKNDLAVDHNDARLFDLVIDTSILEGDCIVSIICDAYGHLMAHPRIDATHLRSDLEVDEILLSLVRRHIEAKRG